MNNAVFNGPFKDIIPLYIKYMQSQGYKYEAGTQQLKSMDEYFRINGYTKVELTEEMVINYCKRRNVKESTNTIYKRQHIIKNFALFLQEQGYNNIYVYNYDYINQYSNFSQYIFTDEEIKKIFNYIDNNDIRKEFNIRDLNFNQNLRMILKLSYCCGLRKNEVLHLKLEDIDIDNGTILIRESKNYCTRIIPVSESILEELKNYIKTIDLSYNDYIFKKSNNTIYNKHFSDSFKLILKKLNIATETGNSPRLHDLRFTFAVKALEKMQNEGQDIYCTLPILSTYMGHKNVKSTEYYLKYTKQVRDTINNKMLIFNSEIYQKEMVDYDE